MPSRMPRFTNCQRAAICGLVLAGMCITDACRIADVSRAAVKDYIPPDWRPHRLRRAAIRRTRNWGAKLEELRLAYADRSLTGRDIQSKFGIDRAYLYRLAVIHGWPPRKHKFALPPMTREQRLLYRKFLRSNMPRLTAIAEACR